MDGQQTEKTRTEDFKLKLPNRMIKKTATEISKEKNQVAVGGLCKWNS